MRESLIAEAWKSVRTNRLVLAAAFHHSFLEHDLRFGKELGTPVVGSSSFHFAFAAAAVVGAAALAWGDLTEVQKIVISRWKMGGD